MIRPATEIAAAEAAAADLARGEVEVWLFDGSRACDGYALHRGAEVRS